MSRPDPTRSTAPADESGPALFRLVRFWSRRWIHRASHELTGEMRHVQHIQAVEAVDTARSRGSEPTVAAVAHQLGLDDSGASRIVRDAVDAGYLLREVSTQDRRRASLVLTDHGEELLAGAHRWQRHAFERLTADWDPEDRERFGRYLRRLSRELDLEG